MKVVTGLSREWWKSTFREFSDLRFLQHRQMDDDSAVRSGTFVQVFLTVLLARRSHRGLQAETHPPSSSSHNSAYIHNLSTPYAKMQSAHTLFCFGWISSHEFWQMLICLTLTDKRSKDIPGRWFVTRKWLLLPVIVESPTAFYIFNHLQLFRSCHADKDSQTSRYWWTKQWLCFSFFPVSSSFERECFP